MNLIDPNSLAKTVDNIAEALFFDRKISDKDKLEVAKWLASRQGLPGAYANMFAPTESDARNGIHLFSGDKLPPSASLRHVLGEETCRVLRLLKVNDKEVKSALDKSSEGMLEMVNRERANGAPLGWFCCGRCTPAYWRHLSAGAFDNQQEQLASAVKDLVKLRDGKGGWHRFPFHWTVSALAEMDAGIIRNEARYIAPRLERIAKKKVNDDKYAMRRKALAERVLNKI